MAKKTTGVYTRPSAAIERGSGFFVPGLEGPRVRLLFGLVLLGLTALNDFAAKPSQLLAVVFAIILLVQAAVEFGKDERGFVVSVDAKEDDNSSETLVQTWAFDPPDLLREAIQWSAASFIATTPAIVMLLLESDKVVYRLGNTSYIDEKQGCMAALETVMSSKSGRVSLPKSHPTFAYLAPEARTVVLQRVSDHSCWMMASDQLLEAFTSSDLKWLGQLAVHVSQQ